MKRIILQLTLLICVTILFFTNCEGINNDNEVSPEDSAAAVVLVTDANASLLNLIGGLLASDPDAAQTILNGIDLTEPNGFYVEASELDWRNPEAHFGVGFTSLLILSQNTMMDDIFGSSVKVYAPFSETGAASNPVGYGFGLPLSVPRVKGMIASYFEIPLAFARLKFESLDTFNEFQTQVTENYIPMVDAGLASLDSIDNDPAFVFTLGAGVQIDVTDITAMESSLFALQGMLKGLAAFNYELDTSDSSAIIAGLTLGSTFAALNSDGDSLLSEAHASAMSSIDKAEQVLAMVDAEDTALNHFFVEFSQTESSQIQTSLNALTNTLSGPTSVEYAFSNERGEFSIEGSASIDVSQYYLNAVSDLKSLLPLYTMSTTTAYNYHQVTLYEHISFEETEVLLVGLNNTPISVNIQYSESNSDTSATVSLGFLTFNLLTANQSDLPVAIWDLWAEFLVTVGDYSDELHHFPEISFQWNGVITTGTNLTIDGDIAIDYLERTTEYTAPDILWTATSYGDWLSGWSDPTVNEMFPDFLAEDLAYLLGISWE
ncbi:MAG: hypothetical protein HQ556_07420 [Candidatus Marinimicrobia bacterium]|nr:hypothetical protein [Candidatus Neomarinimicrobiota bacterium]